VWARNLSTLMKPVHHCFLRAFASLAPLLAAALAFGLQVADIAQPTEQVSRLPNGSCRRSLRRRSVLERTLLGSPRSNAVPSRRT
jgi:hypothetical protein